MLKPIEKSNIRRDKDEEEELKKLLEARKVAESELSEEDKQAADILANPDQHTKEDTNWAKRYSDTKSAWHKDNNANKARIEELESENSTLRAKDPSNIPTDEEGLETWKKENPALAAAILSIATREAAKMQEGLQGQVKELETKEQSTNAELVKAKVKKKHPEFDDFAKDQAFHDWVDTQKQWVKDALYGGQDAQDAIDAITLYKEKNGLLKVDGEEKPKRGRPRKEDAEGAKMVSQGKNEQPSDSGTNKGTLKESDIVNWTEKEWVENLDKYNEAKSTGKIIYDLGGRR